jgi:hypothetical protein
MAALIARAAGRVSDTIAVSWRLGDAVVIAALPLRLVPWSGEPCEQAKVDGTRMAHGMSV